MKNIVLAIDFTGLTGKMLDRASDLAQHYGSKLWLVHVADPDPDFVGYEVGPQTVREDRARELRQEHQKLQAMTKELQMQNIEAEPLLIQGPLIHTLLGKATDLQADLIIVGAHSHSILFEKLMGSSWHDLIRQSKIPLFVIPENP